ncbi:cytochrome c-type biogenesis protein CcmH [Pelagibaculum spongiae]|uniref:Cytochrome c-type biogenesis protein n=2 Tax=Pelagibaculum spongiae TaxID=2080658 RepID=A0A2V1GZY3_9GAMM|nr:cytochrome c-type biogenesis protein CcmH [Pelagibaculum spongiae]
MVFSMASFAAIDVYEFDNVQQQERYRDLIEELRCPKCQNQNIADSNSQISIDMRELVYEKVRQGESNDQIVNFLVDRFGDFVRYRPDTGGINLILWSGPWILLLLGGFIVFKFVRGQAQTAEVEANEGKADEDLERKVSDLLKQEQKKHD